jgi:hypothetical protein
LEAAPPPHSAPASQHCRGIPTKNRQPWRSPQ